MQNPREFSCFRKHTFKVWSVKSQLGKEVFSNITHFILLLGPTTTFLVLYKFPMRTISSIVYPHPTLPWNKYCNLLASTQNLDSESISYIHTVWAGISLTIWSLVESKFFPHLGLRKIEQKKKPSLCSISCVMLCTPTYFLLNVHSWNVLSLQGWWVTVKGIDGTCSTH